MPTAPTISDTENTGLETACDTILLTVLLTSAGTTPHPNLPIFIPVRNYPKGIVIGDVNAAKAPEARPNPTVAAIEDFISEFISMVGSIALGGFAVEVVIEPPMTWEAKP